jgi:hypothetical protein
MQPSPVPRQEFGAGGMPLGELTFACIYKMLIRRKLREVRFNELAAGPVEAYRARTGRQSTAKHVWRAV